MATQRVIDYLHWPVPEGFAEFILQKTRLRGIDLQIARNYLADEEYDTDGYAQLVNLDKHAFSRHTATVFRAMMRVIINLAVEAWEAKYKAS